MYRIKLDNYTIYDIRDKEYIVENPQLNLEVNKVGGLNFKIYPSHPYFSNLIKRQSILSVLKDNTTVFKGQIINDEPSINNSKSIQCEGILGFLNNSIIRPYTFNGTPADHYKNIFATHNAQVTLSLVENILIGDNAQEQPLNDYYELTTTNNSIKSKLLETDDNDFPAQIKLTGLEPNTDYYIYGNPSSTQLNRAYIYTDRLWGNQLATKNITPSGASFNTGSNTSLVIGFYSTSNVTVGEEREITDLYITKGQIDRTKILNVGNITVTDPNDYITRSSVNYASAWKILNEDLIDKLGGYLKVRYETDGTYVDYLEDFDDTSTQVIQLGQNLIDVLAKNNAAEIASVIIPLGADIEDGNGNAKRLDITSVNDGKDYLVNQTALDNYGWIVAPTENTTYDDITDATRLKNKGQRDLDNNFVMLKSSIEVRAVDLSLADEDIEGFWIYEYIRFVSGVHNVNDTFLLTHISIPLNNPSNTQITLGKETNTLTGIQLGNKQNIDNVINRIGIVEKDYQINNDKINDLESAIEYFSVDLSQYNITIPTDSDKKPLETHNYDVNFYGYYKGNQVTPNVTISGSNTGITTSKTNAYLRFAVNTSAAITNTLNEYTITFTYTADGTTYTLTKIIDIALAIQGVDGTGVNILGSYDTLAELQAAHPTGEVGDAYLVSGDLYVWAINTNSWNNVGTIQGPAGATGPQGIPGTPGTSTYFYVRYSANANGNPMTTTPQSNTKYMGVASTTSSTAPSSYSAYTWSETKGADGTNGTPGTPGADGISSYLHIKYSDDGGITFTGNGGEDVGRYRGELVDNTPNDSTDPADYTWLDMELLVEEQLNEIRQEIQTNITSINQNQEQILMEALQDYVSTGDFETFRNTVSTQFIQTAEDFTFNFTNLTSQINTLNGNTQQQFSEILKYIRFIDGTINLGEVGNPIILKIENDEVAFYQNNYKVAYLSNSKMMITDAEITNSLTIGYFAWKPRSNGNLSLVRTGGGS